MGCLVLPVSFIGHPPVIIIASVAELPETLGHFALVDLALDVPEEVD